MDLISLTTTYLQAAGHETTARGRDLLVGTRTSIVGQEKETILVWVPTIDARHPFQSQEGPYLARFKEAGDDYPLAQKFMLVPTFEGISTDFRQGAKRWYNVNIRVPVQFFDSPFKGEESAEAKEASTALKGLRDVGEKRMQERVPQPYSVLGATAPTDDLLPTLLERISHPESDTGKTVHVVLGPAGIGKTVLFESLFATLYADFLQDKKMLRVTPRPRPLPLLPEYLRVSVAPTLKALVEAFLATDFSGPISRPVFEWMITNGFGIWLLDGLDEIVARDPDFFMYFLDLLTMPGGLKPSIVICVRDSLLSTNDEFREFCEEYSAHTEMYELAKWDTRSKRLFAKRALGTDGDKFVDLLVRHPDLNELSSTPYYCRLIADQYGSGKLKEPYTECRLLHDAVTGIISREYGKGLLDPDLVPEASVVEFMEALAAEDMENGFQGIQRDAIEEWAHIVLPSDLASDELDRLVIHMLQLAVFTQGMVTGNVQFSQEILEHYLLGRYLVRRFETDPAAFLRTLSAREIPAEWVTLKVASELLRERGRVRELSQCAYQATDPSAFRSLVQMAAFAAENPDALRSISLERRDIRGIKFSGLDFSGVSFRASDLTDVQFRDCNLRGVNFEEAIVKNTAFLLGKGENLKGARFGNMERFYSLRTESGEMLSDYAAVKKWVDKRTGVIAEIAEPCLAARQLRYLFGKFIHPNGTAKRAILDRHGVLSGKRLYDPGETLEAATRHGYLVEEERYRDRIKRADGDVYSEMVQFVKDLTLSPGLRRLLADICTTERCSHVPSLRRV